MRAARPAAVTRERHLAPLLARPPFPLPRRPRFGRQLRLSAGRAAPSVNRWAEARGRAGPVSSAVTARRGCVWASQTVCVFMCERARPLLLLLLLPLLLPLPLPLLLLPPLLAVTIPAVVSPSPAHTGPEAICNASNCASRQTKPVPVAAAVCSTPGCALRCAGQASSGASVLSRGAAACRHSLSHSVSQARSNRSVCKAQNSDGTPHAGLRGAVAQTGGRRGGPGLTRAGAR